ncbi:hypothetical protein [Actinomycetia phage DSL-LC01]|nr:hypothetical protein [Actinomycetia phage DSL-LC01]
MTEYTYEVAEDPAMVKIFKNGVLVDHSGPWESVSSASDWAEVFVSKLNAGIDVL